VYVVSLLKNLSGEVGVSGTRSRAFESPNSFSVFKQGAETAPSIDNERNFVDI